MAADVAAWQGLAAGAQAGPQLHTQSQLHHKIPKAWFPLYSAENELLHSAPVSKHYAVCPKGNFKVNAREDEEEKSLHPEQDGSAEAAPRGVTSSSSCGCALSVKGTRHCCPMSSDSFPTHHHFYRPRHTQPPDKGTEHC